MYVLSIYNLFPVHLHCQYAPVIHGVFVPPLLVTVVPPLEIFQSLSSAPARVAARRGTNYRRECDLTKKKKSA